MITFSIIKKSQLEGAHRLDAEYYQPEYLENVRKLENYGFVQLQELSAIDITKGETPLWRGDDYLSSGIPFLRSENLSPAGLDLSRLVFVSQKVHERMKRSKIYPNDILIAIVGATIGHAGLVTDDYSEYNSNQAVAIVRPQKEQLSYYLAMVLETKFCQLEIERIKGGGARDNLDLHEVRILKIPRPNDFLLDYCTEIIQEIKKQLENSKLLYSKAENFLLDELGLKDHKIGDELFSVVNFSEIKSANRMDAEYFQVKYEKLIAKLKAQKAKPLTDVFENVAAKFNPLAQPDKFFKYVELSNINASIGIIDGYTEVKGREAPSRAKRVLKAGDVVVSSVEGSLEKVALVEKEQDGYLASTGFFQFRSKEIFPEVLLVVAKSFIVQDQLKQRCSGTILTAVPKESIKDILIPVIPRQIQQKIAEFVKASHQARKKSKELLEEAKRKVEELIEK